MSEGVLDLPGVRQCLLSFYSNNSIFVTLQFTNEIQIHLNDEEEEQKDDENTLRINVLVLLAMTEKYDVEIYRQMHSSTNLELIMPFGWRKTFQDVVNWMIYGTEPAEFVDYQRCAELGRFYGISLPYHQYAEDLVEKLDDMGIPPPVPEPSDDSDHCESPYEPVLQWNGKLYKKRYANHGQNGCYYYCMGSTNGRKCKGSIFVSKSGDIRAVTEHADNCAASELFTLDCSQWDQAESAIEAIACSSPGITAWQVLTTLMQENEALAHCVLQLPLAAILKYITEKYRRPRTMPLDSGLEAQSCIKQESILYQEVYPNDFLIYSHPEVKEHVKNVHWILVDGTFKSCPVRFKQLLTILARDEQTGTFFPILHALMPSRTTDSYMRLFEIVDHYFSFDQLAYITVDFEKSLTHVLRQWAQRRQKKVEIIGCKFHYSKALSRRFKDEVKRRKLRAQEKEFLRAFQSMPFLERSDILHMLDSLKTMVHPYGNFVAYFNRTWMPQEMFDLWNLSGKQSHGILTRYTNNALESLNGRLGLEFPQHPQTQMLLRFLETYSTSKLAEVSTTERVSQDVDATTSISRLETVFKWRKMVESFETRPEYSSLPFSYVCHNCGHVNQLEGRRASHLICLQGCRHDVDDFQIQRVVDEIQSSLLASFQKAQQENTLLAIRAMSRLRFWFKTLSDATMPVHDVTYVKKMTKFIKWVIAPYEETHTTQHRVLQQAEARNTRGRPNRVARIIGNLHNVFETNGEVHLPVSGVK